MIPRTFPSTRAANGEFQMVVYFLGSVTGLQRWVDYIPVRWANEATGKENNYDQNGYINVISISELNSNTTPFKDYVPVFVDNSCADAWTTNVTGYIPVGQPSFIRNVLFAAGEQGVWYDPSDLTTLFQDSAGTQPVTAVEQPVGLMLDKSKGPVLGPELVTNGDFSNGATGWSALSFPVDDGSIVVSGGVAKITTGLATLGYVQQLSLVVGKMYRLSGLVEFVSGSGASIAITNAAKNAFVVQSALVTTVGQPVRREIVFTATETNPWVYMRAGNHASVGKFSDIQVKELPGNHAFQATSASRPVLSARVNLLTKTEEFNDVPWVKSSVNVSGGLLYPASTGATRYINQIPSVSNNGATVTNKWRLKPAGKTVAWVYCRSITSYGVVYFTLSGSGSAQIVAGSVSTPTATISLADDGYYDISITVSGIPAADFTLGGCGVGVSDEAGSLNVTANGTDGILISKPDLRVTNVGVNLPAYQRVNTSTDYDTTGFPLYLKFNGTNSSMATNSINFTATAKVTAWAGVRKLSDAARNMIVELTNALSQSFSLQAQRTAGDQYDYVSGGTSDAVASVTSGYAAPITNVLTGVSSITTDVCLLRINGGQVASSTTDQGSSTSYANAPLYIGARGGTSLYFNGQLYSLIVRGATSTSAQMTAAETWVNTKTRAY